MGIEERIEETRKSDNYVNVEKLADLEQELQELKEERGIAGKHGRLFNFIDRKVQEHEKKEISRKTYIVLLLTCGWLTGAHRFYAGRKVSGVLYLLFCWTGIPFAMSLIDLMQILPMEADENGKVLF